MLCRAGSVLDPAVLHQLRHPQKLGSVEHQAHTSAGTFCIQPISISMNETRLLVVFREFLLVSAVVLVASIVVIMVVPRTVELSHKYLDRFTPQSIQVMKPFALDLLVIEGMFVGFWLCFISSFLGRPLLWYPPLRCWLYQEPWNYPTETWIA